MKTKSHSQRRRWRNPSLWVVAMVATFLLAQFAVTLIEELPKLQQKVSGSGWAEVNLDEVREKLASVIEEAKKKDPREWEKERTGLLRQITELERARGQAPPAEVQKVEVAVVKPAELKRIEALVKRLEDSAARVESVGQSVSAEIAKFDEAREAISTEALQLRQSLERATSQPAAAAAVAPAPRRAAPARVLRPAGGTSAPTGDGAVSGPQQRMLDAMASFAAIGMSSILKAHVAVFAGQSSKSSGFRANLSQLSAGGFIERLGEGLLRLTDLGRQQAAPVDEPLTLADLHAAWFDKLTTPQRSMLNLLIDIYPRAVTKDYLAEQSGQSPLSSGYRANLSTLSSLGLLKRLPGGEVAAGELLFPEGLR